MPESLTPHLAEMRLALERLEQQLGRGELATGSLADFKSMVDDIRLRTWALLAAAGAADSQATAEEFRLRRVIEICRGVARDLTAGRLRGGYGELPELREAAEQLCASIAEVKPHLG